MADILSLGRRFRGSQAATFLIKSNNTALHWSQQAEDHVRRYRLLLARCIRGLLYPSREWKEYRIFQLADFF